MDPSSPLVGYRRCAICCFTLPGDATGLQLLASHPLDAPLADLTEEEFTHKSANLRANGKAMSATALQSSASRGCYTCQILEKIYLGIENAIFQIDTTSNKPHENKSIPMVQWEQGGGTLQLTTRNGSIKLFDIFTVQGEEKDSKHHSSKEITFATECDYPSGDTGSDVAIKRVSSWLTRCDAEHHTCQRPMGNFQPHRLLEVSDSGRIRLVETESRNWKMIPYACLSHRWGPSTSKSMLKVSNFGDYLRDIPLHTLPVLFKDVVSVVRKLGLSYIWIDCLCIIQDSEADWTREAAEMAGIYEHAAFTIAAAWCSDSSQSLFSNLKPTQGLKIGNEEGRDVYIRHKPPHPVHSTGGPGLAGQDSLYPLLGRGWVFQEQRLSKRFIQFTQEEIFYQCSEATWCECRSDESKFDARRTREQKRPKPTRTNAWRSIVTSYKALSLTFDKDLLPAIGGVGKALASQYGGTYLAGLWEEDLSSQLMWESCSLEHGLHPRPTTRNAPSWSWASVRNPVYWNRPKANCNLVEVIEAHAGETALDKHYVTAKNATLKVHGQTLDAKLYYGEDWINLVRASSLPDEVQSEMIDGGAACGRLGAKYKQITFGIEIQGRLLSFFADYSLYSNGKGFIASSSQVLFLLCGSEENAQWAARHGDGQGRVAFAYGLVLRCVDKSQGKFERIGYVGEHYQGTKSYYLLMDGINNTQQDTLLLV